MEIPKLDLSSLSLNKIENFFYFDSLSYSHFPDGFLEKISEKFSYNNKISNNLIKTHFQKELSIFSSPTENSINIQPHDLFDPCIKSNLTKNQVTLKTIGYSYNSPEELNIDICFKNVSNYSCTLTKYSKGLIIEQRESNFDILFNQYYFNFVDILMIEDDLLQPKILLAFVNYKNIRHCDLGERQILILSFTPETIDTQISPITKIKKQ